MKVTFEGSPGNAFEIGERDRDEKMLPRGEQTKFRLILEVACSSPDKSINVDVMVLGEVPIQKVAHIEEKDRLSSVALVVWRAAVEQLSRVGQWEFYRTIIIYISPDIEVNASSDFRLEQDAELNETLVKQLVQVTSRHKQAAESFEKAKDFLFENVGNIPYYRNRAVAAANFIASCMRADGSSYLSAWNREKSSSLLSSVADLAGRKNTAHQNYRSGAERVRSVVYSVHVPRVWADPPPGYSFDG